MALLKLMRKLEDRPLTNNNINLFVNRKEEIAQLNDLCDGLAGKIIGVAGERGIGKTSLFNVFKPTWKKVIVRVMNRDNKYEMLRDIAYYLYEQTHVIEFKKLLDKTELIVRSLTISLPPSVNIEKNKKEMSFLEILKLLKQGLDNLGNSVIILDEIDKEKKEDIIRVLDSIKYAFEGRNTTLIVSLPARLYTEYMRSKISGIEVFNLENIFSYMLQLRKLSDGELREILFARMDNNNQIDNDAITLALDFADGNPRKFLTILREAALFSKNKLKKEDVLKALEPYISIMRKDYQLSPKDINIFKLMKEGEVSKIVKFLLKKKIVKTRQTAYTYLSRLKDKGLIIENEGKIVLSRVGKLFYRFMS